jgi:hypothetical protein
MFVALFIFPISREFLAPGFLQRLVSKVRIVSIWVTIISIAVARIVWTAPTRIIGKTKSSIVGVWVIVKHVLHYTFLANVSRRLGLCVTGCCTGVYKSLTCTLKLAS